MSHITQDSDQATNARVQQLLEDLQRYAGWLGKDSRCARLRASVEELALAISGGQEASSAMVDVQANIKTVGSSAITPLLRTTMKKLRAELGESVA